VPATMEEEISFKYFFDLGIVTGGMAGTVCWMNRFFGRQCFRCLGTKKLLCNACYGRGSYWKGPVTRPSEELALHSHGRRPIYSESTIEPAWPKDRQPVRPDLLPGGVDEDTMDTGVYKRMKKLRGRRPERVVYRRTGRMQRKLERQFDAYWYDKVFHRMEWRKEDPDDIWGRYYLHEKPNWTFRPYMDECRERNCVYCMGTGTSRCDECHGRFLWAGVPNIQQFFNTKYPPELARREMWYKMGMHEDGFGAPNHESPVYNRRKKMVNHPWTRTGYVNPAVEKEIYRQKHELRAREDELFTVEYARMTPEERKEWWVVRHERSGHKPSPREVRLAEKMGTFKDPEGKGEEWFKEVEQRADEFKQNDVTEVAKTRRVRSVDPRWLQAPKNSKEYKMAHRIARDWPFNRLQHQQNFEVGASWLVEEDLEVAKHRRHDFSGYSVHNPAPPEARGRTPEDVGKKDFTNVVMPYASKHDVELKRRGGHPPQEEKKPWWKVW